jgi:hypothetical protein
MAAPGNTLGSPWTPLPYEPGPSGHDTICGRLGSGKSLKNVQCLASKFVCQGLASGHPQGGQSAAVLLPPWTPTAIRTCLYYLSGVKCVPIFESNTEKVEAMIRGRRVNG